MRGFHNLTVDEALAQLDTSRAGLSEAEARDRLCFWGPNRLPEAKGKTIVGVFLTQFRSPFIYLLLAAGAVSLAISHVTDAGFIFVVLVANAGVGTYQEWRAENRARALKALIKGSVAVWRDGSLKRLPTDLLVPGDIVRLESGERIPADLRLIEAHNLTSDESPLTGESLPVHKLPEASVAADAPLGDRVTVLHAGTIVQAGRGVAVVVSTGEHTVVGQLAAVLKRPQPPPPLVRRIARFTRDLALAMLGVITLIAILEALRGAAAADIFLLAVALTVSAIPEGLPVAMTVALSIATHRMGLRNVLVRQLPAIEGLGACTVIATDKTGTLTLNRLTIERVWVPKAGELPPTDPLARPSLIAGAHASEFPAVGEGLTGDAVDLAFFAAVNLHEPWPGSVSISLAGRLPYEPEKRFAAAFHQEEDGLVVYVKGAPERVATFCADIDKDSLAAAERMSARGYRVIAVAYGRVGLLTEDLTGLQLLGFAALIDPLRPEAIDAVAMAKRAGIRVTMITGDHPLTALAIADQLGLAHSRDEVVTGTELAQFRGSALDALIDKGRVFARTEPLQKLLIVESLRRKGHVVAVTGDGINDAPALHAADVGMAMGKGGTDVAREAADLILTDDNFASVVAGIEEGRIAYDNLRKVIALLISTGAAEILLMLLATASQLPSPLTAVQLLWLNLVTNGMQDVALAFEKGEPGVLQRSPRAAHAPVFDRRMIEQVVVGGLAIGLSAFIFYLAALRAGMVQGAARGAVLWLLVWCENAHVLNCRSESRSIFRIPLRNNPLLIGAVVGTQLLQIIVHITFVPLRELLSMQALSVTHGLALGFIAIVIIAIMEAYKWTRATVDSIVRGETNLGAP